MGEFADFDFEHDFNDLEAYDGSERPLLPVDTYTFVVTNVERTTGNGKPMITVESEVVDPEAYAGQKAWNNYMLQSKDNTGLKRLKAFMLACGASLDKFRASDVMGQKYVGDVIHTEGKVKYDGEGNPLPPKVFANIVRERPVAEEAAAPAPQPPPITKNGGKATNNKPAARRA